MEPDKQDELLETLSQDLLDESFEDLNERRQKVIEHIAEGEIIAKNANKEFYENLTLGQRCADKVAQFGGSWPFIFTTVGVLLGWGILNVVLLAERAFDPYPFILMNLLLSTVAALQGPIIMMAQNRQSEKDRVNANANYEVCLKMELELTRLHKRLDELDEKLPQ